MAKFFGIIGYAITKETAPGVWVDEAIEKSYTGDVTRNTHRWGSQDYKWQGAVNPDLTISDSISIVADGFTLSNAHAMKYVKWRGATWSINSVIIERPRVILEIGGLYGRQTA